MNRRHVDGIRDVRSRALAGHHLLVVAAGYSGHRGRQAAAVLVDVFSVGIRYGQRALAIGIHKHIIGPFPDLNLNGRIPFIRRIGLVRQLNVKHHALTAFLHIVSRDLNRRRIAVITHHHVYRRVISHKMLKVARTLGLRHIRNLVAYGLIPLHVGFVFAGRHRLRASAARSAGNGDRLSILQRNSNIPALVYSPVTVLIYQRSRVGDRAAFRHIFGRNTQLDRRRFLHTHMDRSGAGHVAVRVLARERERIVSGFDLLRFSRLDDIAVRTVFSTGHRQFTEHRAHRCRVAVFGKLDLNGRSVIDLNRQRFVACFPVRTVIQFKAAADVYVRRYGFVAFIAVFEPDVADHRPVVMHRHRQQSGRRIAGSIRHHNVDVVRKRVIFADALTRVSLLSGQSITVLNIPLTGLVILRGSRHRHSDAVHRQCCVVGKPLRCEIFAVDQAHGNVWCVRP